VIGIDTQWISRQSVPLKKQRPLKKTINQSEPDSFQSKRKMGLFFSRFNKLSIINGHRNQYPIDFPPISSAEKLVIDY